MDKPESAKTEDAGFIDNDVTTTDDEGQYPSNNSIPVRLSRFTARNPTKCLLGSITVVAIISVIAFVVGDFKIEVDNKGWRSRGTLIAKREMQRQLVGMLKNSLFNDEDGSAWDDFENNVVTVNTDTSSRRRLDDSCDSTKFYSTMLSKDNLFAVYKVQGTKSILDPDVLFDQICEAETKTHEALKEYDVCSKCDGDDQECLAPVSLVWLLRLNYGRMGSSCSELKEFYTTAIQEQFTNTLYQCTSEVLESFDSTSQMYDAPSCPLGFQVSMVDTEFGVDGNRILKYSSSYFFTYTIKERKLYKVRSKYGRTDSNVVSVAYDTLREDQNNIETNKALLQDMFLAMLSIFITNAAVTIHTKSIWLTFIGNLQILLSVPLAYFVYHFIAGLKFFPFLNFMGLFVASALGADDIFVAVDKWKNARIHNQSGSTEDVAAVALPNAASAMLLTTSTTAVAFFATTICPVTPILCFAVFCGLLIVFNYVLNILFIFPALCSYDIWLKRSSNDNCCVNFGCCGKSIFDKRNDDEDVKKRESSLIYKVLTALYNIIHQFRYILSVVCVVATGVCIYFALTIKLPDSADVRLLPESNSLEQHYMWKEELLSFPLFFSSGSFGEVLWGVVPTDNGDQNNPDSYSTLVLDETFDMSSNEAQTYIVDFCDKLFDTEIAFPLNNEYECPINEFDSWLRNQTDSTSKDEAYVSYCNSATSLPMAEDQFDSCMIAWSQATKNKNVLAKNGKVSILRTRIKHTVNWNVPFVEMDDFWKSFEAFMVKERENAPMGVNKMFHASYAFWWYDTNFSMLQTAIGAALIAIAFAGIIVLISSRSFRLSVFSAFCITYVLVATTASLVGLGWDLGFLEAICFAILVGISCDFVIHFGHAYNHHKGDVSRHERTKYALTHMGPSILAAAFTTFAAASVMLFCQVTFFTKFALILLMTIVHATLGSFVVYLVLTDCFGPSEPTKFVDSLFRKCTGRSQKKKDDLIEGTNDMKGQA